MDLRVLRSGWHRHLRHFRNLRKRLSGGQDPKVFCLSCSDSRVSVHEIFDLMRPGTIFEAKNVGGLFSDEAKAALIYAMNHLRPEYIIVLHHTSCGGYRSMDSKVEPEISSHMKSFGGVKSRDAVDRYLKKMGLKPSKEDRHRLIVEEGCRRQKAEIMAFLKVNYLKDYAAVEGGRFHILPLIYDIPSGRVFKVPDALEGSQDMVRREF